jgi:hypothetical protein
MGSRANSNGARLAVGGRGVAKGPAKAFSPSLDHLKDFAQKEKFKVTSDVGGKHNPGSAHYEKRAIYVRVMAYFT